MNPVPSEAEMVLLTGWRGAGKTSLLIKLIEVAKKAGWTAAGLMTPARFLDGQKTGIDAVDVYSMDRRLLASRVPGELKGPQIGPWTFDSATFSWGNALLENALPCNLLVLDEIGPLEFDRRQGWVAGFDALKRIGDYRMAITIVRPEYVTSFFEHFSRAEVVMIRDTTETDRWVEHFTKKYW